jgi:hypothetical protein
MTDTASISSDRQASSSSSYVSSPPVTSPAGRRVSSISHHRPPPLDLSTSHIDRTLPGRPRSQPAMVVRGRGESGAVVATKSLLPPTPASSSYTHQDNDEEYGAARDKKRARSIDVDEANHPSIARLGLYTPTTARSDGPRELICLCAKAPKVPRPRNGMYFRSQLLKLVLTLFLSSYPVSPRPGPAFSSFANAIFHFSLSIPPLSTSPSCHSTLTSPPSPPPLNLSLESLPSRDDNSDGMSLYPRIRFVPAPPKGWWTT